VEIIQFLVQSLLQVAALAVAMAALFLLHQVGYLVVLAAVPVILAIKLVVKVCLDKVTLEL
jgi:hypothetical protein